MSAEQSVLNQNAEPDWKNYDDFARGIDTNRLPGTRTGGAKRCRSPLKRREITLRFSADRQRVLWAGVGRAARTLTKKCKPPPRAISSIFRCSRRATSA